MSNDNALVRMTADFFGKSVGMLKGTDGLLCLTADQAAIPLGLSSGQQVRKLFANHKREFIDGTDFANVTLDAPSSRPSEGRELSTRKIKARVFTLKGVALLALLVRNEAGVRARRWAVELDDAIRKGEAAVVDPVKLAEKVAELERELVAAKQAHVEDLKKITSELLESNKAMASALGSALAQRKHQVARERALAAQLRIGQRLMFGGADAALGN